MNIKMLKCLNVKMKSRGVSLIEMLAAVAIFAITVGAISGLFISAIRTQRRILATQELLDQTSYVLEYMGRALRMAKKDTSLVCLLTAKNYENGIDWIRFLKFESATGTDVCYYFYLSGNRIYESKGGAAGISLTSEKLTVNFLKFVVSGDDLPTDTLQPRVSIFLEIFGKGATGEQPKIQIQTSISQRPLDAP